MIVLHAAFHDEQLCLWGETAGEGTESEAEPSTEGPRALPYGAPAEALAEALTLAGLPVEAEQAQPLVAWLPTRGEAPLPSSPLVAEWSAASETPTETSTEVAPWGVRAVPLATGEALSFLGACADRTMLAPGVLLGADVQYWVRVMRLAGALVAREQFLPGLDRRAGAYRAVWAPVLAGAEAERGAQLARAMPPACRALAASADRPPDAAPATVLKAVLNAFVDDLVRGASSVRVRASARSFESLHAQWLHALQAPDREMEGQPDELERFAEQVEAWHRPVAVATHVAFRLSFRLEEPTGEEAQGAVLVPPGPWYLRFLLQATDDPSLLVDVAEAWEPDARTAALFERRGFDAPAYLLAALGQAMSLYPALEESLQRPAPGGFELDTGAAHAFLTETAWLLQQAGYGVLLPAWWTRHGTRQRVSARASVSSPAMQGGSGLSLDTLVRFNWQLALGDERLTRSEMEALARLKVPLVQVRGRWVEVDAGAIEAALDRWKDGGEATVRELVRMALGAEPAPGELPFEGVEATGWVGDLLQTLESGASVEPLPEPEAFAGTLRPYQVRGYSWMAFHRRWGFGACLADDMGLGKTPQTLALLQRAWAANGRRPALVVCPTSVMGNWQKEAARFTPALPVMLHHGTRRTKKAAAFAEDVEAQAIVITSYALTHRDFQLLKQVRWSTVVLDEAQNIKNAGTKQAQAVRALPADHRVALTGTPVENNVGELWSIMEFLNPGFLGTQASFKRQFFFPIQTEQDPEAMRRLKRLTGPFILRRLKTDRTIIDDLPEKQEMNVYTTLTREQASLYRAVVKETTEALEGGSEGIERKGLVLATLMKLKQICNHPAQFLHDHSTIAGRSGKLARLTEMLGEVVEVGERALIFTQFTEMGDLLKRHLQASFGREALFLHGGVPQQQRERMVERFQQHDDAPPFFLLSLKAGGTGLNLTRANHVFHFDRWWNPAVENQATDRAFRIGQTRHVQVHKFVCIGTVEERIDEMIERKKEIAEQVVGTGEGWITELSTRELKKLFALQKEAVASDE